MRLSKDELMRASKEQLATLGTQRANNKGWLTRATLTDWTPEQVERFRAKQKRPTDEQPELFKIAPTKTEKPPKYRDPMPEQFAAALYEKFHRNLS